MSILILRFNMCSYKLFGIFLLVSCVVVFLKLVEYKYIFTSGFDQVMNIRSQQPFYNRTRYPLLPDKNIIDGMTVADIYLTFDRYIYQKQIKCCNEGRAGPTNGFGKNICLDILNGRKNDCLVYSFGSQFNFDFENAIYEEYKCEIHTFDPSMSMKGRTIPDSVHFHLLGLSDTDGDIPRPEDLNFESETIWKMGTLSSIQRSLQHSMRYIDILKIDIEGWEWLALPQMLQSGVLHNVKQLCLEVHFGYQSVITYINNKRTGHRFTLNTWGSTQVNNQLKILKHLHDYGFRIFMYTPIKNVTCKDCRGSIKKRSTLVDISLVNLNISD